MSKGLFFDLDGTLVDTLQSNVTAYDQAIRHVLGDQFDAREGLAREIGLGKSSKVFLKELIPGIADETIREIAEKKSEIYPSCFNESILNDSLVFFAEEQKQDKDTIIALVTTAKECNAMGILNHHGIQGLFDFKIFGDHIEKLKPDPEIYLRALDLTGISPDDAEAFEDTDAGIKAAEEAGILAHRVIWNS